MPGFIRKCIQISVFFKSLYVHFVLVHRYCDKMYKQAELLLSYRNHYQRGCLYSIHIPISRKKFVLLGFSILYSIIVIVIKSIRPKLKFYLFPLSRPTPKKRPYPKYFISIFSQEFFIFFNFIANCQRELSNVKSAIYL